MCVCVCVCVRERERGREGGREDFSEVVSLQVVMEGTCPLSDSLSLLSTCGTDAV